MRPIFLLLLTIPMFLGCDSDNDSIPPPLAANTFTAQKNDDAWTGTIDLQLTANDTLTFLAIGEGLDNGILMVKMKFDGEGDYTLKKEKALYYDTLGGDVIVDEYTLREPEKATFSIDSYNEANGTVTGTFAIELFPEAQGGKSIEYFLRITEGRFRGTIVRNMAP
ncbi:hypothetical protein K1F50_15835 [Muricauda oceani]|uniref:Uncharacterized protein n=1 Tax=Flagellimonas oceani TaxID=2698672 RepID=A0A6G7IZP2_9FLAO|nr:hypothetical protein [Allomuricauda oceani]MBW8244280.1 hypothetical protein [Allomuricauda oceani]QII44073.1 hypothetical protein GVT53_05100 [Allomuricauda oceani]